MGEKKSLRIQYIFKDRLHQVTVDDYDSVRAPLRLHVVEDERNGHWDA